MDLYLLPGLGADHRIFQRLRLAPYHVHAIDWPRMPVGSTMADFARTMAASVDVDRPHTLIGMSMGGMVAQEMAAITAPARVIILSSWKGPQEMPASIKRMRAAHPERFLTRALLQGLLPVIRWHLGVSDPEGIALLDAFLRRHTLAQLKVQTGAVLDWQGPTTPVEPLVHIHGDKDRLMPIASIGPPVHRVKGGGHFMVVTHAAEVSKRILQALQEWLP